MARSRSVLIAAVVAVVFAAGSLPAQPCIDYSTLVHPEPVGSCKRASVSAADDSHLCSASYWVTPLEVAWFRIEDNQGLIREGTYYIDSVQFPYQMTDVAVKGHLALLAYTNLLSVVDFSTPESPALLSQITAPGTIYALAVCGDYIYVGVQSQGLWLVDISDPSMPITDSMVPLSGNQFRMQVEGDICWVASSSWDTDGMFCLTAFDITEPAMPSVRGSVELDGALHCQATIRMDVDDGIAVVNASTFCSYYVYDDDYCWIFDVTDPSAPVVLQHHIRDLGRFAIRQHMLFTPSTWTGGIDVYRIDNDGALVFDGMQDAGTTGLDIISTENSTWAIGSEIFRLPPAAGVDPIQYHNSYFFHIDFEWHDDSYTTYLVGHEVADGYVFQIHGTDSVDMGGFNSSRSVTVLDVANPASPTILQYCVQHGGNEWETEIYNRIAVNGEYIYTDNSIAGTWHWPSNTRISDFHLDQGYFVGNAALYATTSSGLEIRNLAVPEDPPLIGTLLADHEVHNLISAGDWAYAQCEGSLVVLDVENPLSPLVFEELPMTDSGSCAAVSTEILLLAGEDGLFAYDLLNQGPGHPVQTGSMPGIAFEDVELSGGVAYLIVSGQGLLVVDVSDLANLEVIGSFDMTGLHEISLAGNCLVASTPQSQFVLLALDCSDTVPVAVQDFTATWQDSGFRLAWRLARDTVGLRLDANAGDRTWTVPWTREADGYAALDLDGPLLPGESVTYVLSARDDGGVWQEISRTTATVPELTTALLAPHPNPFNPTTTLTLTLERPQDVRLTIHDLAGREVRRLVDVRLPAGRHTAPWDGCDRAGHALPAGTYIARLQAGDRVETRKLSLVK